MATAHVNDGHSFAASPHRRVAVSVITLTAAVAIALAVMLCAAGKYREAAAASLITLAVGYTFAARVAIESILIFWFATTPLASFYARFPLDKSIITYNRAVIVFAVVMLLWKQWAQGDPASEIANLQSEISDRKPEDSSLNSQLLSQTVADSNLKSQISNRESTASVSLQQSRLRFSVTKFEIAWALLALMALASAVMQSLDAPYAIRIAVDAFWLPLVMFHLARRHFDVRGRTSALMMAAIALALFLFATGAYEFATGTNLFAYKGSELVREGERRVNGPFAADSSYAIICLLMFLFLLALPRLLRARFDRTTRLLYAGALVAAAAATLLPLFRATAIALVLCWILLTVAGRWRDTATRRRGDTATEESRDDKASNPHTDEDDSIPVSPHRRITASALRLWLAVIVTALVIGGVALSYLPFGRRLADPRNAFGRLATWEAATGIALENPLLGIGLTNYQEHFYEKYNWEDEAVEEVFTARAANSPHSNWLWIAAELGLIALALYAAANVYLFRIGWRALRRASDNRARVAAACYLAIFAAYLIPGLTLASGAYSDLNLCFFFMLGLLSNTSLVSDS